MLLNGNVAASCARLHGGDKVDDDSVQALEQVLVGVDARRREAAEGAREVQEKIALPEMAAPVLEVDDRVGVLVEDLLRVVAHVLGAFVGAAPTLVAAPNWPTSPYWARHARR